MMAQVKGKWIENNTVTEPKLAINNTPTNGYVLSWNGGSSVLEWATPSSADAHDVKATINDTTPSYLNSKILVTTDKLTKTLNNSGANETLTFSIGSDVFDKSADDTDDVGEGSTNLYYTDVRADARITAQKGNASGLCPLDAGSKVDSSYLPGLVVSDITAVADIAARDALTSSESGDMAIVADASSDPAVVSGGATYIYDGTSPYVATGWLRMITPDDTVQSVNGDTGVVVLDTDDIGEGSTNLYYSDARARAAISAGAGISYNNTTGVITTDLDYIETKGVETITLDATNISNKYVDLAQIPKTATATEINPVGGPAQEYTVDYTVVSDGADVKRLNWNGLGMDSVLEIGDKLIVSYTY